MQAMFSQAFFPSSHLSLGGNQCLSLLSNQIINNCDFSSLYERFINPIHSTLTTMIVSRLKLGGYERAEVVLVCFDPACVFSSPTVLIISLHCLSSHDFASYFIP